MKWFQPISSASAPPISLLALFLTTMTLGHWILLLVLCRGGVNQPSTISALEDAIGDRIGENRLKGNPSTATLSTGFSRYSG